MTPFFSLFRNMTEKNDLAYAKNEDIDFSFFSVDFEQNTITQPANTGKSVQICHNIHCLHCHNLQFFS